MAREINQILAIDHVAEKEKDRHFVTSLARGLEVLRAFQPGDGLLGNLEIARRTGLPRPTVSRLTATLAKLGYLEYVARLRKYRIGASVLALGYVFLSNLDVRRAAHAAMQELADYAMASVTLSTRDRLDMLYIDLRHGAGSALLRLDVGSRIPIASSAAGFAFLAASKSETRGYFMKQFKKKYGKKWPGIRRQINRGLREVKDIGFCTACGLVEPTINAAATPIVAPDGSHVLAINCTGPSFQLSEQQLREEIGPRLVITARNIEAEMVRYGFNY